MDLRPFPPDRGRDRVSGDASRRFARRGMTPDTGFAATGGGCTRVRFGAGGIG